MSKSNFNSINYSRVVCEGCGSETTIEPGRGFSGLNCDCKDEAPQGLDTELSTPVQEELDYTKTQTVTVIGTFENGDYEVCNGNDLSDTWRVPKDTFEATYELTKPLDEVQDNEAPETTADNEDDSLSKGGDPLSEVEHDGSTYTITLGDLTGLTVDEIKDKFNMDELRVLAKALKVRGASNMGEEKLIGKLLAKAE